MQLKRLLALQKNTQHNQSRSVRGEETSQEIHVKDIDTMKPELHLESVVYEIDQQCFN